MKILITGGKSIQALKLVDAYANDAVVLADYGDAPSFPSTKYHFISLGERNDDIIAHNLLNYCLNEGVDAILPLYTFEIEQVAKSTVLFKEFNIDVLMPDTEKIINAE